MRKNIILKTVGLSILSVVLVLILSGCKGNNQQSAKDSWSNQEPDANSEELKKPISQDDLDKELEAIEKDLKNITADDLNDADLNENNL